MVKNILFSLSMLFILIFCMNSSFALDIIGPNIQIVKNEVTPEPVEPGNDVTLKVMITNSGDTIAENININTDIDSPFYFKKSDFNKVDFSICGRCSYEATYYLSVNSDTISGIYPINFNILYNNNQIKKETVLVKVVGVPDLIINYNTEEIHYPNEKFNLNLEIKNIGTGNAKNIKITSLSEDFILIGSQTKTLESLDAKNKIDLNLNFQISPKVISKLYKLPFEVSYKDELGVEHTKRYEVSVKINEISEISIQNLKIKNYQTNIFDEIIIEGIIENNGFGKAENVYAYVETDLEGYKKSFVGTLNSKEDSPILFKLKSTKSGNYPINVILSYEDDLGVHTSKETLEVKITKPTSTLYTGLVILLILISIFIIRNFMKRKNEKN